MSKIGFGIFLLIGLQMVQTTAYANHFNIASPTDTNKVLKQIQVNAIRYANFSTGTKYAFLDSTSLKSYQAQSLASALMNQSQIFIKQYGPGTLATTGFRGGNANHTAIIWNGFNLQSPMNGQTDLSLIPAFFLNQIAIQYGSPASNFGSGNISGAIHLQTKNVPKAGFSGLVMTGAGSFAQLNGGLKLAYGGRKFWVLQNFYVRDAQNNFTYKELDLLQPQASNTNQLANLPVKRMNHAQQSTNAWLQEIQVEPTQYLKLSLRTWLQQDQRNFPTPIGTIGKESAQQDKTKKLMLELEHQKGKVDMQLRYGLFSDWLNYVAFNGENSESHAASQTLNYDAFINWNKHKVQLSGMAQEFSGTLVGSGITWQQQKLAVFATYKKPAFKDKFIQQLSGRQEWVNGKRLPFMPSYGFSIYLKKNLSILGNAAKSYRLPTFNDLYWPKMGNANLLPETGWNEEVSISKQGSYKNFNLVATLTIYNKNIQNWILWLPAGGGLSKPMNVHEVWSRGAELDWKIKRIFGHNLFSLSGLHDYNKATIEDSKLSNDASLHQQMIYSPGIKHHLFFLVQHNHTQLEIGYHYIGTRYVSSDHSNWLNPYHYTNVNINHSITYRNHLHQICLNLNNLFNQTYQVMVNNPMPLMNYQLTYTFKF